MAKVCEILEMIAFDYNGFQLKQNMSIKYNQSQAKRNRVKCELHLCFGQMLKLIERWSKWSGVK